MVCLASRVELLGSSRRYTSVSVACFIGFRAGSTSGSLGSRIQECAAATDLGLDVFLVVSWSFTVCVLPFAQKLPLFILRPLVASGLFLGGTYGGKGVYTTWQQRRGFFPCLSVQHFYFFSITIFYT